MEKRLAIALLGVLALNVMPAYGGGQDSILSLTAHGHPMQYYLSLPHGWSADKRWPVVVVVEASEKEFRLNAERFVAARDDLPFIIVAPIIVSNGNYGHRDPKVYPYDAATWDLIDHDGVCAFDEAGVAQIVQDVRKAYGGEERFFLEGFEAGAHLVWTFVFRHPEMLLGAAPVAGNYRGRCMEDGAFSADPARLQLPVVAFVGTADTDWAPGGRVHGQFEEAKRLAGEHGFRNVTETLLPGVTHLPIPGEILRYFSTHVVHLDR